MEKKTNKAKLEIFKFLRFRWKRRQKSVIYDFHAKMQKQIKNE